MHAPCQIRANLLWRGRASRGAWKYSDQGYRTASFAALRLTNTVFSYWFSCCHYFSCEVWMLPSSNRKKLPWRGARPKCLMGMKGGWRMRGFQLEVHETSGGGGEASFLYRHDPFRSLSHGPHRGLMPFLKRKPTLARNSDFYST